jgi:hypothetical protein
MNQKVTDSLHDEETGKDILFMLQESTRKNYADRVSYEEEEGKGKVAAK